MFVYVYVCIQLVMNYLIVEGYRDAAENFVEESGTEAKVDLATIEERVAIRKARRFFYIYDYGDPCCFCETTIQ